MSIAANRFKGIYAALCWSIEVAKLAVEDDCANVLVLPVDFLENKEVVQIINTWLHAKFKSGRYQKRLKMMDK
jgi:ribose 5-phosphate isomerase B